MSRCFVGVVLVNLLIVAPVLAQDKIELTVRGAKEDRKNVPVCVPLSVPAELAKTVNAALKEVGGKDSLPGQWTAPGLLTESVPASGKNLIRRDLHFIVPEIKAGATKSFTVDFKAKDKVAGGANFQWQKPTGEYVELWDGSRPVLRYMYRPYDNSTPDKRNKSYKVFHHLYDPDGKSIITNGGQTDPPGKVKLLYPHHRGLMFAFNSITYGNGVKADTWHAVPKDTHEEHTAFLNEEAGPVLGRHRVAIDWHGGDNAVFAKEEREITVYGVPGGTLIEFATRLKTTGGKVHLDGDPQHAGFQFRAHNDVSDKANAKQTYYLRPDGKGKPGETKQGIKDMPWNAMSFVLGGPRYTVAYIDNPNNPGPKHYSERDYGRFGGYMKYDMTEDHPLVLNYRIWLQAGEMTGDQVQALRDAFVTPLAVTVK